MNLAILQALAIAVGGLSSLGSVLIVLLLLNREAGPSSAFCFGLGYWGAYQTIGVVSVVVGKDLFEARAGANASASASPSLGVAVALCVLGVLVLTLALRQWRQPASTETPALFAKLDELGPAKALGIGALIPLINFKNLAIYLPAVAVLAAAPLTPLETVIGVVAVPAVFCGAMLTPLLIYLVMPGRAGQTLARMRRWIETNSHMVARVLLPIIGLALLAKGGWNLWTLFGG